MSNEELREHIELLEYAIQRQAALLDKLLARIPPKEKDE